MTGMHRSPYQGFSVEFAQHRQYAPGDDLRFLDWKVFGRSDKLYIKQYIQETNLDLVLMVDVSGSMGFTSKKPKVKDEIPWRKYDHAATLGAALAYMSLGQQDRVGLTTFADHVRGQTRMSNSHDHWRNVIEVLSNEHVEEDQQSLLGGGDFKTKRTTDLATLFDQMTARLDRRSLLVLVSDLFDEPESLEHGLALLKFRGHDLIVFQTLDNAEVDFPYRSPTDFIGLENEGRLGLDPAALRKAYLEIINAHLEKVEQLTRRFGFDYLMVNTSDPVNAPLGHFLARRAAMLSKKTMRNR